MTSQILTIRRILEGVLKKKHDAKILFVDFSKASDPIKWEMERKLIAYSVPKETLAAIMMLYKNTKVKVGSPYRDTDNFDIVVGMLQGETLASYQFIICLDYVIRTSIDLMEENGVKLAMEISRRYPHNQLRT